MSRPLVCVTLNGYTVDDMLKDAAVATAAGADLVEVFLENTEYIALTAEQDSITSVNPSFSKGAGIRVFLGKSTN